MTNKMTANELVALFQRVFEPGPTDRKLAIIVDMPGGPARDNPDWLERREMAAGWAAELNERTADLGLEEVSLVLYPNARANNADLPGAGYLWSGTELPQNEDQLTGEAVSFETIFDSYQMIVAPTEFSATAPLKMAAKNHAFRAATMPGFIASMVPALRLDYGVIGRKVDKFKELLDKSVACKVDFDVEGTPYVLNLDLRYRKAHASGGVFKENGVAGNLPSGESYIVPYEGEREGDPSRSSGELPVQFGDEVVVYRVVENKAVEVVSDNAASKEEASLLAAEPAYGNMAELGLGVLGDFGLDPTGEILLDEKLGLHIAFGRSEHFGGQVGPSAFSAPDKVVHIDRVFIPKLQPKVAVPKAVLELEDGEKLTIMENGRFIVEA